MINIPGFTLFNKEPNEIHYGFLFNKLIHIPCANANYQDRYLRIWVPEDFDISKKYIPIYMLDGQNAVDRYLTLYGEWDLEDRIKEFHDLGYRQDFIIIGIDCPSDALERFKEYVPYAKHLTRHKKEKVYGDKFGEYLVNNIVPYVNSLFILDKKNSIILGSSSGGLYSFYLYAAYPNIFKHCISYSPDFNAYTLEAIYTNFTKWNPNPHKYGKLSLYMGLGDELERKLEVKTTIMNKLLVNNGFSSNQLLYVKDEDAPHNEAMWSRQIITSLIFIFK